MFELFRRPRPRTHPHNHYAGCLPRRACLGRLRPVPQRAGELALLLQHVDRVVPDRGRALRILHLRSERVHTWCLDLAEV